jgi:transcription elongation factor Elf1
MSIRRKIINCLSCENDALIVIKNHEVIAEIEYCPFCGTELKLSEEEMYDDIE